MINTGLLPGRINHDRQNELFPSAQAKFLDKGRTLLFMKKLCSAAVRGPSSGYQGLLTGQWKANWPEVFEDPAVTVGGKEN